MERNSMEKKAHGEARGGARRIAGTLALCAVFVALSFVLSNVRIFGSIAFDSLPAFLAALLLAPRYGAAVGALGHLFTALLSGFPYTVPVHLLTALLMAVCVFVFGAVYRSLAEKSRPLGCAIAVAAAVAINGPLSVLALSPILGPMMGGWAGLLPFMGILTVAAAINVGIAYAVYLPLARRLSGLAHG